MLLEFFIFVNMFFEIEVNLFVNRVFIIVLVSFLLLGIFLIIIIFIVWKDLRLFFRKIFVFILIGDFLIVGGNLFGVWLLENDCIIFVCKV